MKAKRRNKSEVQRKSSRSVPFRNPTRAEIERRIKEIDAGTAKSVDAFEALKKM